METDREWYNLFKKYHIINLTVSLKDQELKKNLKEENLQTRQFVGDSKEKNKKEKRKGTRKGKEPVVGLESVVEIVSLLNPNRPLIIFKPSEGVSLANLSVAVLIFRGQGEAMAVSDKESNWLLVVDTVVKELFEEADDS